MREELRKAIADSLYVHFPLKPESDRSIERVNEAKDVLRSVKVWDGHDMSRWTFDGEGEALAEDGSLKCHTYPRSDHWPDSEVRADDAANGFYATFGSFIPRLDVSGFDIADCNRISFMVKPVCPGLHSPIVRVGFTNNGAIKIPDQYSREGFNAMNLRNNEWNHCTWEIEGIAHDRIGELSFNFHRYGKEVSTGDDMWFELRDIEMQKVEPNVVLGWECAPDTAVYSTTGYLTEGRKTAIANTSARTFSIIDSNGSKVLEAPVEKVDGYHGSFSVLDFSSIREKGLYRISVGSYTSPEFEISDDVLDSTLWKLTNFLFCERCGFPVPGKHGACHGDVIAEHNGVRIAFNGGWHDAADVSQQTMQSAEIVDAMMAAAEAVKDRDSVLYLRMREEANWAMDFILRMNFGDGYHATHAAIRRWTDNQIGNMDDCEADVRYRSFEDFVFAAVEADAHFFFKDSDEELAWKCLDSAKADYRFAAKRFAEVGVEEPHMHEHTANASRSQYYAAAAWAAAKLYEATGDEYFASEAASMADAIVACQDVDGKAPMHGFFYRDESKRTIVHFSHQARDHIFVMALDEVCKALEGKCDTSAWESSMKLFGEYLKTLRQYTMPYGMIPAGLYHISEIEDEETFNVVHPHVVLSEEKDNYIEQLENGISLGDGYFIRSFPVWFSYRGNSAIQLSMGKAASILGRRFGDDDLMDIAREQLYWTLGKNPFGQSLIYGEGERYGQEYTALLGETVGEMPVGVQTRRNEDLPYWPPASIATYREVWTTPPGRWMWIAADLI